MIRLIRAYLNSGIMRMAWSRSGIEGTPQGGPLSPLLANVLLDEVDKELERRGHCFVRYADDCERLCSQPQGGRTGDGAAAAALRQAAALTVNEAKSAVASVFGRKFLGYAFWVAPGGVIKRKVAAKPMATFKQRIRQLTRRSGGRSMQDVVDRLRPYLLGWKAYFRLAQTPRVWLDLDRMAASPAAGHPTQAVETRQDHVQGIAGTGSQTPRWRNKWRPTAAAGGATAGCSSTPC